MKENGGDDVCQPDQHHSNIVTGLPAILKRVAISKIRLPRLCFTHVAQNRSIDEAVHRRFMPGSAI